MPCFYLRRNGFLFFLIVTCFTAFAQDIKIPLQKEAIVDPPGQFIGISNLFFSKAEAGTGYTFPESWKDTEADMLVNQSGLSVYIFRIKNNNGEYEYYADLDNNKKIESKEQLHFIPGEKVKTADFNLAPQFASGKSLPAVKFQLLLADKYVYGRITEQRTGIINSGGNNYKLVVRPSSRNNVQYSKKGVQFFIDLNSDNKLEERLKVENGAVVRSEEVNALDPFRMGNKSYVIDSIDAEGNWLSLKPYTSNEGLGQGFRFPSLPLKDINNNPVTTNGKYTIVELWSTSCPWCEMIRSKMNALKTAMGEKMNWITISREEKKEVDSFLKEHPMQSTMVIPTKKQWEHLNPATTTPLFYLIDDKGNIVLKGAGANLYEVLEKLVMEVK